MKFLPTFGVLLLLSYMVLLLFADVLFRASVFIWPVIIALIGAGVICTFVKQSDRMNGLEKRIKELEEKNG